MPKINLLSRETAELIAAGEVVERPASAIKEIVENSIDAGAHSITVEIERGGIVMMRVTDDGCGISHEDVPIAFLRHATSKISGSEDLDNIGTLGFRGEALAAISTVAKVEMFTKPENADIGTRYVIEGGTEIIYEEVGCKNGTCIEIRDLFYNTPARMKFLKKDMKEGANVAAVIDKMALSHPEISFRFIRDGKPALVTQGNGNIMDTVYAVYGRELALGMIPIDYSQNGVRVSGLICKPFKCRPNRNLQTVFLNGRYVKSGTVMAALDAGYKNSAMVGKFPYCVINIEIPFSAVDVNVHPAKTEVRFSDESRVFDCVHYGVKQALSSDNSRPQVNLHSEKVGIRMTSDEFLREMAGDKINLSSKVKGENAKLPLGVKRNSPDFFGSVKAGENINSSEAKPDFADRTEKAAEPPKPDVFAYEGNYSVLHDGNGTYGKYTVKTYGDSDVPVKAEDTPCTPPAKVEDNSPTEAVDKDSQAENTYKNISLKNENPTPQKGYSIEDTVDIDDDTNSEYIRLVGEVFRTYIIAETEDKLLLIDKHAAHERIIFEELKKNSSEHMQMLLTPSIITLSPKEHACIVENIPKLSSVGFDIEDFGDGALILRAVPAQLSGEDYSALLSEVSESLRITGETDIEKLDRIYHTVACKAACKAGSVSSAPQLEELVRRAVYDPKIRYCPHGRPVAIELKLKELEKMFGRIQ